MAVNFLRNVYEPCFDLFARPITIQPLASIPGAGAYDARGIFDSNDMDIEAFTEVMVSSARIELDILADEFGILPRQKDIVRIPFHEDVDGGDFEIADLSPNNAGGEITLQLKRLEEPKLFAYDAAAIGFSVGALDFAMPVLT
jgi:hypothetical protein